MDMSPITLLIWQ